jgi:GNAT superfamily N-acetyltransferase
MTITLSEISLRKFTNEDIALVLEKHKTLYAEEFGFPPEKFGKMVSDGLDELVTSHGMMWIAEYRAGASDSMQAEASENTAESSVWAGSVAIVPMDGSTGRLRFMLIDPTFRGCGLSKYLLQTALDYCRQKNYRRVTLSTTANCVSAHRLYRKNGFAPFKIIHGTEWGGSTDEWWEKELESIEEQEVKDEVKYS